MKMRSPLDFFHKNMSHEQLLFTWSTFRDSSMGTNLKYFWKTHETVKSARIASQKYISRMFITFPQRWEVACEQRSSTDTCEKSSTKPVRFCCPLSFGPTERCATISASLFISFQTKCYVLRFQTIPRPSHSWKHRIPQFEKIVSKFNANLPKE